jgi:predicted amidophosphoribosyltransferase
MKTCWRCRIRNEYGSIHHINGNHNDDWLGNKVNLCLRCHDLVQGICDKCAIQSDCHFKHFANCWRFEDALPPIYFKPKDEKTSIESIDKEIMALREAREVPCVDCGKPHLRKFDIDLWCPKCLEKLIVRQDPERWKRLQKWKKDLDMVKPEAFEAPMYAQESL